MRIEARAVDMTGDGDEEGDGSTFSYSVECDMTTISYLKFYSLHTLHNDYMIIFVPTRSFSMWLQFYSIFSFCCNFAIYRLYSATSDST